VERKSTRPRKTKGRPLEALSERLLAFEQHYRQIARSFEWTFDRADLNRLLSRLDDHPATLMSAA